MSGKENNILEDEIPANEINGVMIVHECVSNFFLSAWVLGSISAALSCLVYRGRSAGSFPEQRLVIEPTLVAGEP